MSYSVVQSTAARNALTPNVDDQVFNKETGQIERCVSAGPPSRWVIDEERLTGTLNVRKYQDAGWIDANGISTVGTGQAYLITPAEISAHPEWRGKYYAGIDTRDYVCIQEALLEAYGANTANGQYYWDGGTGKTRVWLPNGYYFITRPLWYTGAIGTRLHGVEKNASVISGTMPDTSVLYVDGIHSSQIDHMGFQLQTAYTNAHGGGEWQGGWMNSHFYKPVVDVDWFGTSSIVGNPALPTPSDYVGRVVADAASPYLERLGSTWATNSLRGKYVVIVDDPGNPTAVGQVRRIMWNTATRLFIAGRWDWLPSAQAQFLIDPTVWGYARWHGYGYSSGPNTSSNKLTDWFTDYTAFAPTVDAQLVRRFTPQAAGSVITKSVSSHTKHTLYLDSNWAAGQTPLPRSADNPDEAMLGGSGHAEPPQPEFPSANYAIGGTLYTSNGGTNPISSSNDNWVKVSGTPWVTNALVGGYVEISGSAQGMTAKSVTATGTDAKGRPTVSVSGAGRSAGDDIGKRLIISGDHGGGAIVLDNTTDTWSLDRNPGIGVGTTVELVDPVLGQIYPVAQNEADTIHTVYENFGSATFHRWYWSKIPKPGDTVVVHARHQNLNSHGDRFEHIDVSTTGFGDSAFAWSRSGDGSMGSETSFYDCAMTGNRVACYSNGQNVIDLKWNMGALGASKHGGIYFPRAWMHVEGVGIGVPYDSALGCTQVGPAIVMGQGIGPGICLDHCYIEGTMLYGASQPTVATNCNVANPVNGWRTLNRTWVEGDLWIPQNSLGRNWRCVELFGNGSTAAVADPSLSNSRFGEAYDGRYYALDGAGNGALFIRMDYISMAASPLTLVGGQYGNSLIIGNDTLCVTGGAAFSRPDFMRQCGAGNSVTGSASDPNRTSRLFIDSSVRVTPILADGNAPGDPIPFAGVQDIASNTPLAVETWPNALWMSRAIMMMCSYDGQLWHTGLAAFPPRETGLTDPNNAALLAVLDFGDATDTSFYQTKPTILGKRPRGGADTAGADLRLAGGQSTGAAHGGGVSIEVAPAGSSGTTLNALTQVGKFDGDATPGNTRFLLWDVSAGTLKRVSIGGADSGGAGYKLLRVPN